MPNRPLRVILHIGATKTGSSALQAHFFRNRAALAEAGVLYPTAGVTSHAHHLLAAALHPGAWRMHANALPEDRLSFAFQTAGSIVNEARETGADTVILSSEYLWAYLPPWSYAVLTAAFAKCRIVLAASLRHPEAWMYSTYLQSVKSGEQRDYGTYVEAALARDHNGLDAARILRRWIRFTETPRLVVWRYEDVKTDVASGFYEQFGIDAPTADLPPKANPSPTEEGTKLLLDINRSDASDDEKARQRKKILSQHRTFDGNPHQPSSEVLRQIWDRAGPAHKDLAEMLGRAPLYTADAHRMA